MKTDAGEVSATEMAMAFPFVAVFGAPVTIAFAVWHAFVLFMLWGWYLPTALGTPRFSVAFGTALIAELLFYRPHARPLERLARPRYTFDRIVHPGFILAGGWLGSLLVERGWL